MRSYAVLGQRDKAVAAAHARQGGPGAGRCRLEDHRHDGPGTETDRRTAMTRKQRRLSLIGVAGCVLALALGLVLYAMNDTIVFFNSPADIQAKNVQPGTRIRLGGLVKEGSVQRGADQQITFEVMDAQAAIQVQLQGPAARPVPRRAGGRGRRRARDVRRLPGRYRPRQARRELHAPRGGRQP